jgi:hypothetical protein
VEKYKNVVATGEELMKIPLKMQNSLDSRIFLIKNCRKNALSESLSRT